jgi:HD-like signal output (HDOD) protein
VDQALKAGVTFLEVEKQVLGFDHTELASDLCTKWKLPENHVSAMRFHHDPAASGDNQLAYIVHTANFIAQRSGIGSSLDADLYELDPTALSFLSLDEEDLARYTEATLEAVARLPRAWPKWLWHDGAV